MRIIILFLFFITSCSSLQSGNYVQVRKGQSLKTLAKEYGVKEQLLRANNQGKSFSPGTWVFVPKKVGFLHSPLSTVIGKNSGEVDNRYLYAGKFLWPVPASTTISSFYGKRRRSFHDGLDIPAPRGTHILSSDDGEVIYSANKISGYGKMIVLKHPGNIFTVYAHMKKMLVSKGDKVQRGQVIGQVGSTGRSTGPHLHYEVRINNKAINPLPYVQRSRKVILASRTDS